MTAIPTARPTARPTRALRSLRAPVVALCAAATLTACASGQGPSDNQLAGAGVGAVLGAGAGMLVGGDDRRNALVGAGIGLLAGAAVGSYLDQQEDDLRQDLSGTGADVKRVDDALLVTLPGGVTFDTDSTVVKPEFKRPLNRVAKTLQKYPSSYVDVIGHTDSTGEKAYNKKLSNQRAKAVASELIDRGVKRARIESYGRGENQPVASNETAEGRAANRRVEILIVPATDS
ncbi:OmpA family protein [Albimonas sp. CAU 1670]|uniref:OmpA family protein n=1 Tax=Albimonas sp. CAU 1670 TaxID=3032599 RepID=UPI0023DA1947|nr:OmpA family protein [Albimonas sp. CAU 1670]MDF2233122.1 OmpA family protein [Albimonas sp. CAU 1670]